MPGLRDWDYIEARLLAPANDASQAHGRLRQIGYTAEADKLMEAMKTFNDSCRAIREEVRQRVVRDRQG